MISIGLVLFSVIFWGLSLYEAISKESNSVNPLIQRYESETVVHVLSSDEYFLVSQSTGGSTSTTNSLYRKLPSLSIAIEMGYDTEYPNEIEKIKGKIGEPIKGYVSDVKPNASPYEVLSSQLVYFNALFAGTPKIINYSKLLPRFDGFRVQNAAIIPLTEKNNMRFMIARHKHVVIVDSIYVKFSTDSISIPISESMHRFHEQDHRLYKLPNGDILVSGTVSLIERKKLSANDGGDCKMGYKILTKNPKYAKDDNENPFIVKQPLVVMLMQSDRGTTKTSSQKNWGPMIFKKELHFVYSVSPLVIVKPEAKDPQPIKHITEKINAQFVDVVSSSDCLGTHQGAHGQPRHWSFGVYRGGTPAMMVRGQYLAFMHTRSNSDIITKFSFYVMGAYTFSTQMPFKLTAISPKPITDDLFKAYDRIMRVVVFPMTFYLEDKDGNEIPEGIEEPNPRDTNVVLTLGLNDADTGVVKMNLDLLLASLRPVLCRDKNNTISLMD